MTTTHFTLPIPAPFRQLSDVWRAFKGPEPVGTQISRGIENGFAAAGLILMPFVLIDHALAVLQRL
jgi:hypothetical protein